MFSVLFSLLRTDPVSKDTFIHIFQPAELQRIHSTRVAPLRPSDLDASVLCALNPVSQQGHRSDARSWVGVQQPQPLSPLPQAGAPATEPSFPSSSSIKLQHFLQTAVALDLATSPTRKTRSLQVELCSECKNSTLVFNRYVPDCIYGPAFCARSQGGQRFLV